MLCAKCGKKTKREVLVDELDLTPYAGLRAFVEQLPAWRCSSCGDETVKGPDLERSLSALAEALAAASRRLSGEEARFLRKRLGLTQDELGERIGANKITISDWERGAATISKQYDYILRGLVMASLHPRPALVEALRGVHEEVVARPAPIILPGSRTAGSSAPRRR